MVPSTAFRVWEAEWCPHDRRESKDRALFKALCASHMRNASHLTMLSEREWQSRFGRWWGWKEKHCLYAVVLQTQLPRCSSPTRNVPRVAAKRPSELRLKVGPPYLKRSVVSDWRMVCQWMPVMFRPAIAKLLYSTNLSNSRRSTSLSLKSHWRESDYYGIPTKSSIASNVISSMYRLRFAGPIGDFYSTS